MKLHYSGRVRDKAASAGASHLADVCLTDQPFQFSLTATALKGKVALELFELQAQTPSAPQQQHWMCVTAQVCSSQVGRLHRGVPFSPPGKYPQLADNFQHLILPKSKADVLGGFLLEPTTSDMFLEQAWYTFLSVKDKSTYHPEVSWFTTQTLQLLCSRSWSLNSTSGK